MGSLHPLLNTNATEEAPLKAVEATVSPLEPPCALCGAKISGQGLRYQLVPPQSALQTITVCHTCRRAALGEGYRPAV
jgi:hypothetical protein